MVFALVLGGCVSGDLTADLAVESDENGPMLLVDGESELSVLPNGSVTLRVRYSDPQGGSVAGVQVDFALTGAAQGASLSPFRAQTDENGRAETKLVVGSMPGAFEVRAGTRDTPAARIPVTVREALDTRLVVKVVYPGLREVASYTVTALDGMSCREALAAGVAGDVVYRFASEDRSVDFSLAPDLSTALVAWGRDKSGGQLARGCLDYRAPITADIEAAMAELVIALADTSMQLDRALPIELQVDVLPSVKRLGSTVDAAVALTIAPSGSATVQAGAAYYLDAIARRINKSSSELASRRAELATLLAQRDVGPEALGARVRALLEARSAGLQVRADYQLGVGAATRELRALPADGSKALSLAGKPALGMTARFDAARAELALEPLRLELALGAYGRAVLAAIAAESGSGFAALLDDAAGCTEFVGPWAEAQGICDRASAVAACTDALKALQGAIDTAIASLPTTAIELRGAVRAHDRSEDGSVDDLGPSSLRGTWGTLEVTGEMRGQAQTALVL